MRPMFLCQTPDQNHEGNTFGSATEGSHDSNDGHLLHLSEAFQLAMSAELMLIHTVVVREQNNQKTYTYTTNLFPSPSLSLY